MGPEPSSKMELCDPSGGLNDYGGFNQPKTLENIGATKGFRTSKGSSAKITPTSCE